MPSGFEGHCRDIRTVEDIEVPLMEQVFKLRSFSGGLGNRRLGRCWLVVWVQCLGLGGLVAWPKALKEVILIGRMTSLFVASL